MVLFVLGDKQILNRSRMIVNQLSLEYSVKIARNYSAAYRIIVEHQVDVLVCGPSEVQFHQNMADAYRFMESARRLKRYEETPMILISDVEDPSSYCDHNLSCYDIIDTLAIEHRLCETLGLALRESRCKHAQTCAMLRQDKMEARRLYIQNQNVLYPVKCAEISHVQTLNRGVEVSLHNGVKYEVHYITLQQFLEVADVWYLQQCSRSGIINANYVQSIDYTNRVITMRNSEQVAIGSTYMKTLHAQFPKIQEVWLRKRERQFILD